MSFISYAQNFEDVMLWRALKHVENGFYIDVGANDPVIDSVTRAFYERGWHGINIEPLSSHYADLLADRPRDINLQCAAGEENGEIEVWECDIRGWATASASVVAQHLADGHAGKFHKVPVFPLAQICAQHVSGEIHFLKIDVEGFEKSVVEGMDFLRFRPWILVIEATRPNSTKEIHEEWESNVLAGGYLFAYSDGLNRFYIAKEHIELLTAFRYPPNVFDGYVRSEQVNSELRMQQAEVKAHAAQTKSQEAEVKARQAEIKTRQAETKAQQAEAALALVYRSHSWRVTAPLRTAVTFMRKLTPQHLKLYAKFKLQLVVRYIYFHPKLCAFSLVVLNHFPQLKHRFVTAAIGAPVEQGPLFYSINGKVLAHPRVFATWPNLPEAMLLPTAPENLERWVRLTGHVEGHYSLAIVNRGLAGALEQVNECRLAFVPYHGQPYIDLPVLPDTQQQLLQQALTRVIPDEMAGEAISLVHHYPFISDQMPAGLRCILFFWEETSIPVDTISHLNSNFDVVFVAADSVKRALINSGCRPQVFVIPIGVDHLVSVDTPGLGVLKPEEEQVFRFLHVSSAFERKGVDVLLAAYLDAFTADDPVELYIKTYKNPHNQIHAQLEALLVGREAPAKVIIDEGPLDDAGMLELYRSSHAMVLPTRGEGFNLPAAEALAMGLPVLTTGYSAQVDFCSHATATLLGFRFASSRSHLRAADACWLEPSREDLSSKLCLLRKRILQRDPSLEIQRQAGLLHIRNTYTWINSAKAILNSVAWFSRQPSASRGALNVAVLSPWASRCGIAEYSHNLLRELIDQPNITLSIFSDDRTEKPVGPALPCWTLGDDGSVLNVLARIGQSKNHVVLVQHQPSLFQLSNAICQQLLELQRQGRVVVLELHSTLPLLEECRLTATTVHVLAGLDRIIVHNIEDLNNLLALGLADNVMLLNLGVIQPPAGSIDPNTRASLDIPEDALVLGCFGFALAHKGIDTLLEALKPLASAINKPVHLLAINSALDERSVQLIDQYKMHANSLGVDRQVTWITDYRQIDEVQNLLCASDCIVFPYKQTRESASGAVTIGLSTLRPVLVSPLDIFSDVQDVTWRMEGCEASDVVQAVLTLTRQVEIVPALLERQRKWLQARDWNTISDRLLTLFYSLHREQALSAEIAPGRQLLKSHWNDQRCKQLLVDVSEIYYRDARTGIQRVVRSLLNQLFLEPPPGFSICPVYGNKISGFRYTKKFHPNGDWALDEQAVQVANGDVFLGLDLAAHLFPEIEQHLATFRLAGVRIYYVVYDIIPLRHPQFTIAEISHAFESWLHGLARSADGLICISQSVAQDVNNWLHLHSPVYSLPGVDYFHLGADVNSSSPSLGLPENAQSILDQIAVDTVFLMVGTLEPRKGHRLVLDAFEVLWNSGFNHKLLLVGKQGWNMDKFAERLRTHPENGKRLFWLEKVSDEYLEKIYRSADCLIAASECEGFGLPLIEAAQHGLPIIARDIPVFREVAGAFAYYFSAESAVEFSTEISDWIGLYEISRHPESADMPYLTWGQSTKSLLERMDLYKKGS